VDDLDAADFDDDGSPIHAGDVDGVDIDDSWTTSAPEADDEPRTTSPMTGTTSPTTDRTTVSVARQPRWCSTVYSMRRRAGARRRARSRRTSRCAAGCGRACGTARCRRCRWRGLDATAAASTLSSKSIVTTTCGAVGGVGDERRRVRDRLGPVVERLRRLGGAGRRPAEAAVAVDPLELLVEQGTASTAGVLSVWFSRELSSAFFRLRNSGM
jgi:hypothetical protein